MNTPLMVPRVDAKALPQWNAQSPGYIAMHAPTTDEERNASRFGAAFHKYWWVLLALWALVAIPATFYIYSTIPPQYVAIGYVNVAPVISNPIEGSEKVSPFYTEYLRTQAEAMKYPSNLKAAAEDVRLRKFKWFNDLPDQVTFLTDNVQVEPSMGTQNIRITMAHKDPEAAKVIVDSVFDAYDRWRKGQEEARMNVALGVLRPLARNTQDALDNARNQLTRLTTDGNSSWSESDRKVLADVLVNAKQIAGKLEGDQFALEAKLNTLKEKKLPDQALYLASVATDGDPQIDQWTRARNAALLADNELASKKATDQHPERVSLRKQVKNLEQKIEARRKEIQDHAWDAYKSSFELARSKELADSQVDLDVLKQQLTVLNKRINEQEATAQTMGNKLQPIAALREQIAESKEALKRYTDRIQDIEKQNAAPGRVMKDGEVLQPATPTVDRRPRLALAANGVGFMLGLAALVILVKLRDKIDHAEDLPDSYQPLIVGTVSHAGSAARGMQGRVSKKILGEEMRLLHANLLPPGPMTRRIMMITSPTPANGKTSIASQLALSLAKSGFEVLLIDADLRKRDLSTMFDVGFRPGLADLLQGKPPELIRPVELLPNLRLMGAGSRLDRNPVELFQRQHFHEALNLLQEKFDVIVVDTPPTLVVADARLIARSCDEVLCVVRANVSSPRDVNQTLDALARITGKTPKIIVNGVAHKGSYYKYKFAYASAEDDAAQAAEPRDSLD